MNTKLYDTMNLIEQYLRLEAVRESIQGPQAQVTVTVSIPNTELSYTGSFPQVTLNRILLYKQQALEEQIQKFQSDKEVFK